jgi:hypothetical protein
MSDVESLHDQSESQNENEEEKSIQKPIQYVEGYMNPTWNVNTSSQSTTILLDLESVKRNTQISVNKRSNIQNTMKYLKSQDKSTIEITKPSLNTVVKEELTALQQLEEETIKIVQQVSENKAKVARDKPIKQSIKKISSSNPTSTSSKLLKSSGGELDYNKKLSTSSLDAWSQLQELETTQKQIVKKVYKEKKIIGDKKGKGHDGSIGSSGTMSLDDDLT